MLIARILTYFASLTSRLSPSSTRLGFIWRLPISTLNSPNSHTTMILWLEPILWGSRIIKARNTPTFLHSASWLLTESTGSESKWWRILRNNWLKSQLLRGFTFTCMSSTLLAWGSTNHADILSMSGWRTITQTWRNLTASFCSRRSTGK